MLAPVRSMYACSLMQAGCIGYQRRSLHVIGRVPLHPRILIRSTGFPHRAGSRCGPRLEDFSARRAEICDAAPEHPYRRQQKTRSDPNTPEQSSQIKRRSSAAWGGRKCAHAEIYFAKDLRARETRLVGILVMGFLRSFPYLVLPIIK